MDDEDNEEDEQGAGGSEQIPQHTSRADKNRRQRTSGGETGHQYNVKTRRSRTEEAGLDQRRKTETYIRWTNNSLTEYDNAKKVLNKLYLHCLSYNIVDKFYEKKPYDAPTKNEYKKQVKALKKLINYRIKMDAVRLVIKTKILFMDNPRHRQRGRSMETNRARRTIEEIYKFEYRMKTLQLQTCSVCRENRLEFSPKDPRGGNSGEGSESTASTVCTRCRSKKHAESDYFLNNNLHPVWHERESDGSIRTTGVGEEMKPVVRYDIPEELSSLTMAEKLLIRRCSPLIPSHHIKNGIYGINGHCVCFPQDIGEMCNDLPHVKSDMVIFVRNISNSVTGVNQSRHFKVDKNKVLRALRWLKVHHRGYHNITITDSNLDWVKNGSVYDITNDTTTTLPTKPSRRDVVMNARETVSGTQTETQPEDDYLDMETVHPNYNDHEPNAAGRAIIKDFVEIAEETNQTHQVCKFPHIDHNAPPIK